jgi:catechol 2,3-dioxygenase-like lactoylglutathione lyase family enzyme
VPPPDEDRERVTGIGGLFFLAEDPAGLGAWYARHLGIDPVPADYGTPPWRQEAGPTVFAPFGDPGPYLGPTGWGLNLRVRDLDAMVAQLRADGVEVAEDPERYPNGRFASLHDPEGNAIQLWEPAGDR